MIIIGLSDLHSDTAKLNDIRGPLSKADLVLLVGDITNFGHEPDAEYIVETIMDIAPRVLAVSGNCDYPGVDMVLSRKKINLHNCGTIVNDIGFVGVGGSITTPFNTPNERSEDDFKKFLEKGISELPKDIPFILVSHQPPINTACDIIRTGAHVGSTAVRQFISEYQPLVCFTGHIHESGGTDTIGKTQIINPGQFRKGGYAYAEINAQEKHPVKQLTIKNGHFIPA